jgi:hypothetical protein
VFNSSLGAIPVLLKAGADGKAIDNAKKALIARRAKREAERYRRPSIAWGSVKVIEKGPVPGI